MASGERALEGSTVSRRPVRREHDLDWQLEQRAQPLEDLLTRLAIRDPPVEKRQAGAVVDERVAKNDRLAALDPEYVVERKLVPGARLDADRQPIASRVWLPFQLAGAVRRSARIPAPLAARRDRGRRVRGRDW